VADAFTCFVGGRYGAVYSFRSGYGGVGIEAQPFALAARHDRRRKTAVGSRRGSEKERLVADSGHLTWWSSIAPFPFPQHLKQGLCNGHH
jgi:hypothetical protein